MLYIKCTRNVKGKWGKENYTLTNTLPRGTAAWSREISQNASHMGIQLKSLPSLTELPNDKQKTDTTSSREM